MSTPGIFTEALSTEQLEQMTEAVLRLRGSRLFNWFERVRFIVGDYDPPRPDVEAVLWIVDDMEKLNDRTIPREDGVLLGKFLHWDELPAPLQGLWGWRESDDHSRCYSLLHGWRLKHNVNNQGYT